MKVALIIVMILSAIVSIIAIAFVIFDLLRERKNIKQNQQA
jgi:hypothetical protein